MDSTEFKNLVLKEFPELRERMDWDDVVHMEMSELTTFTQTAINAGSFDVVQKSFRIAEVALESGDDALLNAIYVSYLETLDFRGDAGKEALKLMPAKLSKGRDFILDYFKKLMGRKRCNDER
jgi:hypothetical protein